MIARAYPKYKNSGIEWLGDIPEHWEVLPVKRITNIPVTDGPHETPEIFDDGIPFISAEAIKDDKIDFSKKRGFISVENHVRFSKKYKPQKGDIYIVKSGATTGNVAFVETEDEFNIWSPLAVIRPDHKKAITSFTFFFMKSINFFQSIELSWSYGTQQNIGMNVIENLPLVIPPLSDQNYIATFLDRETARIDTLIEKKQRQIELLEEKRSALINHAVTKGLDPNAKMKDSGIAWLGEIPEHWEVKPIKYLFVIINGSTPKSGEPDYWDGNIPWATPDDLGSLKGDTIRITKRMITNEGYQSCGTSLASEGSLVVSTRAPIGHLAIAGVPLCTNQGCRCLISRDEVEKRFYYYQLLIAKQELESWGQGSTFKELGHDELGAVSILSPPIEEQHTIAAFLDRETARIDAMTKKIHNSIDLLREYRTALISAAVTGKIDVRGETV